MKRYIILIILAFFLLSGCIFYTGINGSGRLVSTNYSTSGFYAVRASDASVVTITRSNYYSISVICDDNLIPFINIHSDGYYLYIEMLPGYNFVNSTFSVNITMPDINALKAQEAADVQISGFTLSDNLNLNIQEASKVSLYLTDAVDIDVTVQGSSFLDISSVYPVENLDIGCSEASNVDLKNMKCSYGEITVSDASSLRVNMIGSLIGQVSGASTLFFKGNVSPGPLLFSGASGIVYY